MSKKYSIVFPYIKRAGWLHNTLLSYYHHYKNRDDYEVIIVEDVKNREDGKEHHKLKEILKFFTKNADKYIDIKLVESNFINNHNPAPLFNLGVSKASGEYICITNPEVFHKENILAGFDKIFDNQPNSYIVCGCENIHKFKLFSDSFDSFKYEHHSWYQHTKFRNARYHFCSCLSKENYLKMGGFDERFSKGYAYDDDAFRDDVEKSGIGFILRDDLLTLHQAHESTVKSLNVDKLLKRNKCLYLLKKQNKTDKEIEEFLNNL